MDWAQAVAEWTALCIAASTPLVGPEAGGTVVTLKLAGDVPSNHQRFFCKFDDEVVVGTTFHYTDDDGSAAFMCEAPAGSGTVTVTFSLNGVDYSDGGALLPPLCLSSAMMWNCRDGSLG
jgi:hypothetical protein